MEWRLFDEGTIPEWTTPEFYAGRDAAPHLEQEGHRDRLLLTADMVERAIIRSDSPDFGPTTVVDFGAGDGGLMSLIPRPLGFIRGFDLQPSNVEAAKMRGIEVELCDVVSELTPDWFEPRNHIAVCAEFLEHLIDPHGFVARLRGCPFTHLIASSPYTETADSHYAFHTWAWDRDGYRAMIEAAGWRVIRQETAWICQVLLAVPA